MFNGGTSFSADLLEPVIDTEIVDNEMLEKIPGSARENVKCLKLADVGITEVGGQEVRGANKSTIKQYYPEANLTPSVNIVCDNKQMTLARWPNNGFASVEGVIDEGAIVRNWQDDKKGTADYVEPENQILKGAVFTAPQGKAEVWQNADDMWVYGMWKYDWADLGVPVSAVSAADNTVTTEYSLVYGVNEGGEYFVYNLLEELDSEGEWYIDTTENVLYIWPPEGAKEIMVSDLKDSIISMNNCENIKFSGIDFINGLSYGICAANCQNIVLENCEISNVENTAVYMTNAQNCHLIRCNLHDLAGVGIRIVGGDNTTLTSGNNSVIYCEIRDYAQKNMMYNPAVLLGGVGTKVAHNEIYNAPHAAILISGGNDNIIEYNDIHDVLQKTDDAGAIYMGKSWIRRGNVIRNNYIHHLIGNTENGGVHGVYLDDFYCGTTVESNVFENIQGGSSSAIAANGRDNIIADNIFVDCQNVIRVNGFHYFEQNYEYTYQDWKNSNDREILSSIFTDNKDIYVEKYGESILDYKLVNEYTPHDNLKYNMTSKGSVMRNNVMYNTKGFVKADTSGTKTADEVMDELEWTYEYPLSVENSAFTDAVNKDYSVAAESEIYNTYPDFKAPDFKNIGR